MKRILFITQKRSDAIGIVDESIKSELKNMEHYFDFLELHEKGNGKISIIKNYIINIISLVWKSKNYKTLYFSRENPYVIFSRIFGRRKKIFMTVHHVEDYRGESFIGRLMIKCTDKFIAISKFTKGQLIGIGAKNNNIYVNYNGISKNYYPEKIENFQAYKYILYVGTEVERKNTDTLLTAFSEIIREYPDLKLVKIGKPGTEEAKERFDKKVKDLGIDKSVIIKRTFVSEDELRKRYSNALCYISLSKLEGFGLTIPEAMACGCPIIASDIGPFREICNREDMLINYQNNGDIISKILKIYLNENYRNELSIFGIKRSNVFNWEKNTKNLLNYIQN